MVTGSTIGRIIFWDGPFLGLTYDGHIWLATQHLHSFFVDELFMGGMHTVTLNIHYVDGHFTICPQIVCPFKRNGQLNYGQFLFNVRLAFVRSRVEHINGYVVRHGMFKQIYRGDIRNLRAAMKVTIHTSAVVLRTKLRYHPVGPQNHF